MNFQQLNQNLIKSFEYVKKDVLKLKESQRKTEDELYEKYEKDSKKIKEKIEDMKDEIKKELSKNKEYDELNKKTVLLLSEIKNIKSSALTRKELNTKVLALYSQMKREENNRNDIRKLQKTVENMELMLSDLNKSTQTLEKSRLNIKEIENIFVLDKNFKTRTESINEKIKLLQTLEKSTESNLLKTNEKVEDIKKYAQKLVPNSEFQKTLSDMKKQTDNLSINVNKINKETVNKSELDLVSKESAKNAEKLKEKINTVQNDIKGLAVKKEILKEINDVKINSEIKIIEANRIAENKASRYETRDLSKMISHNDEKTKEKISEIKKALTITENKTKEIKELKQGLIKSKEKISKLNSEIEDLRKQLKIRSNPKKVKPTKKRKTIGEPIKKAISKIVYYFNKPKKTEKKEVKKVVKTKTPKKPVTRKTTTITSVKKAAPKKDENKTVITKTTTVKRVGR